MKTIIILLVASVVFSSAVMAQKQIPGIAAVDVYGNFTDIGFTLDRSSDAEYGSLWTCSSGPYIVHVYGSSTSNIRSVKATFQSAGGVTDEARQFFGFVASVPYDGADQERAKQWAMSNINKAGSITIGRVKYTMYVPSGAVRMLTMEGI